MPTIIAMPAPQFLGGRRAQPLHLEVDDLFSIVML
jgi:hypothetical protein